MVIGIMKRLVEGVKIKLKCSSFNHSKISNQIFLL